MDLVYAALALDLPYPVLQTLHWALSRAEYYVEAVQAQMLKAGWTKAFLVDYPNGPRTRVGFTTPQQPWFQRLGRWWREAPITYWAIECIDNAAVVYTIKHDYPYSVKSWRVHFQGAYPWIVSKWLDGIVKTPTQLFNVINGIAQ